MLILSLPDVSSRMCRFIFFLFLDSSVFVNLKLLEQRAEPPPVAPSDVPMFCNNIDLSDLEQMDPMTQRVKISESKINMERSV